MLQTLAVDYTYQTYNYTTGTDTTSSIGLGAFLLIFIPIVVLVVLMLVASWKIFKKAGKPGWAAIVPIYNTWVLFEITGYPAWLALLAIIPFLNFIPAIVGILASFKLAKLFGKSSFFGVMNVLFPFVTYPILAFGSAKFQGSSAPHDTTPVDHPLTSSSMAESPEPIGDKSSVPEAPATPAPTPSTDVTPANPANSSEDHNTPPSNPVNS
jgi:hypothetical protein